MTVSITAVLFAVVGVACGDDAPAAPLTAEQLAARLVDPGDLPGAWSIDEGPDDVILNGVVTDEMRPLLPTAEVCDTASAESRAAAEALEWMAFGQFAFAAADPLDPPSDRTGHIVFMQEFLMSGEADEIRSTYDLMRAGWEACLGDVPAGEEGPGTVVELTLPAVGDAHYGTLTTFGEAGGWAEWRVHSVLVRSGSSLAVVVLGDVHSNDVAAEFTDDEVGAIVQTIIERLEEA